NTFTIQNLVYSFKNRDDNNQKENPVITLEQAESFKQKYQWNERKISIFFNPAFASTMKTANAKTDPNISVKAIDKDFLNIPGFTIDKGRNFSQNEIESGSNSIIIGYSVFKKLFPAKNAKPIGKEVLLDNKKYLIIGVLASRGSSSMTNDNVVMISIKNALNNFYSNQVNYSIMVEIPNSKELVEATDEATAIFRMIRRQRNNEEDNFRISKSDRLASELFQSLDSIRYATLVIGLLTLISAGIGLMNILLVSINERTREIGVSKALGATRKSIIKQYLVESIMICQIGGITGIIVGILLGNVVALIFGTSFIIPWLWMICGFLFCFVIGLSAGVYPAFKAGNLNPVEALRHE
ncbi:MAG: ABC transporter permease, partial [Chitinophagales bacterium]|nr:ABC transporter permease [Chitinophagales bacterium]